MKKERFVVIPADSHYEGGVGYTGPILTALGFPEGPYLEGVAKIFVRQARSVDPKMKFKIVELGPR